MQLFRITSATAHGYKDRFPGVNEICQKNNEVFESLKWAQGYYLVTRKMRWYP